jgi:hypothetical protein
MNNDHSIATWSLLRLLRRLRVLRYSSYYLLAGVAAATGQEQTGSGAAFKKNASGTQRIRAWHFSLVFYAHEIQVTRMLSETATVVMYQITS